MSTFRHCFFLHAIDGIPVAYRFRVFAFIYKRQSRPAIVKTYKDRTYTLNANDARYTLPFPQSAIDSNPELND